MSDHFRDLEDEVVADEWLIAPEEISCRRLIKRTARHNIYKADWFGDVLVYEPRGARARGPEVEVSPACNQQQFDQAELNLRLSLFRQEVDSKRQFSSFQDDDDDDDSYQQDSAYSSVSSTPKQLAGQPERLFDFPASVAAPRKIVCELPGGQDETSEEATGSKQATLLNGDSFPNGTEESWRKESQASWLELNELRLVAHENFMLFMGASVVGADDCSTSLVMQMNHPKSVSLFNLLHASKLASCSSSPVSCKNRFFNPNDTARPLSLEAKLNICQQVTDAMTYLHDKNIVHGKLTSVNIYIEHSQRVKISLIDNSEQPFARPTSCSSSSGGPRKQAAQLNLPALTYLSPEVIKSLQIVQNNKPNYCDQVAPVQIDLNQLTKMSDVYSFGTILYELFEEKFPFSTQQVSDFLTSGFPHGHYRTGGGFSPLDSTLDSVLFNWNGNIKASASELIYRIGSGQISQNLQTSSCSDTLAQVIQSCWSSQAGSRPQFKQFSFIAN